MRKITHVYSNDPFDRVNAGYLKLTEIEKHKIRELQKVADKNRDLTITVPLGELLLMKFDEVEEKFLEADEVTNYKGNLINMLCGKLHCKITAHSTCFECSHEILDIDFWTSHIDV